MARAGNRILLTGSLAATAFAIMIYFAARGLDSAEAPAASSATAAIASDGSSATDGEAAVSDVDPPTLAGAVAKARPLMADRPAGSSAGTLVLVGWSTRHLGWSDVAIERDETSWELVSKSPDTERGKRLCTNGKIVAFNPVRTDAALYWNGVLLAPHNRPFAFQAVGAMGSLVAGNNARLCGVVTGRTETREVSGRPKPAVVLVGLFDVPQNHGVPPR